MADMLYDYGLDEWKTWTTDTFKFLALKSTHTPSQTHHYVSDISADECSAAGYARATAGTKTRTVNTTDHRIVYDCADPTLGSPAAGETIGAIVVFRSTGADGTSPLMAYYDVANFDTDGAALTPVLAAAGLHYIDAA